MPVEFLPHVSVIPAPVVYATHRRHPIYFWNKTHVRSVCCVLMVNPCTKKIEVEYFDKRTYNTFINKAAAEHFLGRKIPDSEHDGKLYVEKVREMFMYYICKRCGHLDCLKTDVVVFGPYDLVSCPISTTTNRTCPHCEKASVEMDISTEPSPKSTVTQFQDCDLAR